MVGVGQWPAGFVIILPFFSRPKFVRPGKSFLLYMASVRDRSLKFDPSLSPFIGVLAPGLGFPKFACATWNKEIGGFRVVFSPGLDFSSPSTVCPHFFCSLKRIFLKLADSNSLEYEKIFGNPLVLLCDHFEPRPIGNQIQRSIIDVVLFEPPRVNSLAPSQAVAVYQPPQSSSVVVGGSSVLYSGPSYLKELDLFLDNLTPKPQPFPASTLILDGFCELSFVGSNLMHGRYVL